MVFIGLHEKNTRNFNHLFSDLIFASLLFSSYLRMHSWVNVFDVFRTRITRRIMKVRFMGSTWPTLCTPSGLLSFLCVLVHPCVTSPRVSGI